MAAAVSRGRAAALGKALYGALFTLVLPAGMVAWARATADVVRAPAPRLPLAGGGLALAGLALGLGGMWALWRRGGGLPMNAFPPPRLVSEGPYAVVPHPIYTGFCLVALGASLATGSASGLWLVTPTAVLGCLALVQGYERDELRARLGPSPRRPLASLPPAEARAPSRAERAWVLVALLAPWLLGAAALARVVPPDALDPRLAFERSLPVCAWTELLHASAYPLICLAPLVTRRASDLRRFAVESLGAMAVVFAASLLFPLVAPPRAFVPASWLGEVLAAERGLDLPGCAAPSLQVALALVAAEAWASRVPRARGALWTLALLAGASGVTTGSGTLFGVAGGLAGWLLVRRRLAVWERLRRAAESLANSFSEVRLGPVRVLNSAGWAALSTFVLVAVVGTLLGPGHLGAVLLSAVAGLLGAAAWAQAIEGASLSRPYGFYGGLLGIILGALAAPLLGTPVWWLLGACAVAGPTVQALGRIRCLVQGCCHGHPAPEGVGIRVSHPRSRVCALSPLQGVPIHAAPLYSMLWNGVTGLVLVRLWTLGARPHLLGGLFLLLNGLGRFVEEAYRGEPQTPVLAGLRLYQWAAIASALAGVLLTALGTSEPLPAPSLDWRTLATAAGFGLVSAVAAGVDFPESSRRFSRLA
jgi:prolipoprotein diacylglyceryltransferase/protein-S-isoprenylcysteine O-methyltransferase Ste14